MTFFDGKTCKPCVIYNAVQVESDIEKVRGLLTCPDNLTIHMAVNVNELTKTGYQPDEIWSTLVPQDKKNGTTR